MCCRDDAIRCNGYILSILWFVVGFSLSILLCGKSFQVFYVAPGKDVETIVQICLPFFFHQPHGFFLLFIPFRLENRFFIAYKESYNGCWIFESMQLEVIGIILRSFQFIKDVVVEPFDQIDTFRWREEIFRHDVAELAIRDVLDMVGRDIGNLSEGKVPCQVRPAAHVSNGLKSRIRPVVGRI